MFYLFYKTRRILRYCYKFNYNGLCVHTQMVKFANLPLACPAVLRRNAHQLLAFV
jgi:hypothetical protein